MVLITDMEKKILSCVWLDIKNLATTLSMSENTVRTHSRNLYQKFNVKNKIELCMYAAEHGLLVSDNGPLLSAQNVRLKKQNMDLQQENKELKTVLMLIKNIVNENVDNYEPTTMKKQIVRLLDYTEGTEC